MDETEYHSWWGNRICRDRTLEHFKRYGSDIGKLTAEADWEDFLFYRDPKDIALTNRTIKEKAEREYGSNLNGGLRTSGLEWARGGHIQDCDTATLKPRERKAWLDACETAYAAVINKAVDQVIPKSLRKGDKLNRFCQLLSELRFNVDDFGHPKEYGLRLSGRKKNTGPSAERIQEWAKQEGVKPEEIRTPTRKELRDWATAEGAARARTDWKQFMESGDTHGMREWNLTLGWNTPGAWFLSDLDHDYASQFLVESFQREIGKNALQLAPASAWKNSYLICVLYDEMLRQESKSMAKKMKATGSSAGTYEGFWNLRLKKQWDEQKERQEWQAEERQKIEKRAAADTRRQVEAARRELEAELQKKKRKPRAKVAGARLGGLYEYPGLELLEREDPHLAFIVRAIADALAGDFGHEDPDICSDVAALAFKLFLDAGIPALIMGTSAAHLIDEEGRYEGGVGHDWNRVGEWNIDFGAGQFGFVYPLVTVVGSDDAWWYGPSEEMTYATDETELHMYPYSASVLQAQTVRDLEVLHESDCRGPTLYEAIRRFRDILYDAGVKVELLPPLATLPAGR